MKYLSFKTLIVLNFIVMSSLAQTDTLHFKWQSDTLLTTVESVLYDKSENIIYASCINGNPIEKDSNGFISKLTIDGKIIDRFWINGLNAPKGMGIYKDKLYVTDIDKLIEINIVSGKITNTLPIKDAQFLNDVAISNSGVVYFSDMYTNTIYTYYENKVEIFVQSKELNSPNGLFIEDNTLFIGSRDAILKANTLTNEIEILINNTGSIDGLKKISTNEFLISDWRSKVKIVSVNRNKTLLNTEDQEYNAADFEYIPEMNQLIIPTFFDNRIMCYELIK